MEKNLNESKNNDKQQDLDNTQIVETVEPNIKQLNKKQKVFRSIVVLLICVLFFGGGYLILTATGTLGTITAESVKNFILSGGVFSRIYFILLQFLQVTFIPLPSIVTTLAGALVFGPYEASIMSLIAIWLGSLFAFWLGKKFGKSILSWMVGYSDAQKWSSVLSQGEYAFFLMMLFPIFPDDVLCMIAGVTNMSYKFFIVTNLISRPLAVLSTCFMASGYLIPFSGWGLYVWAFIGVVVIVAVILCIVYKGKIEKFIRKENIKIMERRKERKDNRVERRTERREDRCKQKSLDSKQKTLDSKQKNIEIDIQKRTAKVTKKDTIQIE